LTGHEQEIYSIDFAPRDGRHIASGSGDKTLRLWDLATESCMVITVGSKGSTVSHTRPGSPPRSTPRQHRGPDGTDAHAYETTTSEGAKVPDTDITSVAFSPDGSVVAAGSLDWNVRVWSVSDGTLLRILRGHTDSVYSIGWTPNCRSIVSGSLDCTAKLWDWEWDPADLRLPMAAREKGKEPLLNLSSHKVGHSSSPLLWHSVSAYRLA
jgi:WD40 repeat protein